MNIMLWSKRKELTRRCRYIRESESIRKGFPIKFVVLAVLTQKFVVQWIKGFKNQADDVDE